MPATAGRVRMPSDNSVSDSLKSSEIWQKSVGYDPYAPGNIQKNSQATTVSDVEEKAKGLFTLARLTGSSSSATPGACSQCGYVGHLSYQCHNKISMNDLSNAYYKDRITEVISSLNTRQPNKSRDSITKFKKKKKENCQVTNKKKVYNSLKNGKDKSDSVKHKKKHKGRKKH